MNDFGITTLNQLKAIKENPALYCQLTKKLNNEGIFNASAQVDAIKLEDIENQIAVVKSPYYKKEKEKRAELTKAIKNVEVLREAVEKYTEEQFNAAKTDVEAQLKNVLDTVKNASGADFTTATAAAVKTRDSLITFLKNTIKDTNAVKVTLTTVEMQPQALVEIIKTRSMLCGFLISPNEIERKDNQLVQLPPNPEGMIRKPDKAQYQENHTYYGSKTKSFAVASASKISSTIATAAKGSGGGFTGSGVAAVSAAASYANSKMESTEQQKFDSDTRAECGQILYIYVPKESILFDTDTLKLNVKPQNALQAIAVLPDAPDAKRIDSIKKFYEDFGSHFFLECTLGGRYEFTAKGSSFSRTSKGQLVDAVADTTDWAVSSSGSYVGLGGSASTAASVKGQKSVASAQNNQFALNFDEAKVVVTTAVTGGILAPKDVWADSLQYNATWAVIDRNKPIAIWELLSQIKDVNNDLKKIVSLLETVWVREIFAEAVKQSYPLLYQCIINNSTIDTCKKLSDVVKNISKEPDVVIKVITATSGDAEHPKAVTSAPTDKSFKLIGGGAMAEFGNGAGNMLTGSYPEGDAWVASAKSHVDSSMGRVTAHAIYLYDPFNLWEVKRMSERNTKSSNRPEATVKLPSDYTLTGGGAKVEWNGKGILLTACCPVEENGSYTGWMAKGKDHYRDNMDSGTATAWVFGIKPINGVSKPAFQVFRKIQSGRGWQALESNPVLPEQVIVGGGAAVTWLSNGGLLTGSSPSGDNKKWKAKAKDHKEPDTLELSTWTITLKGKTLRQSMIEELNACTTPPNGGYNEDFDENGLADNMAMLAYYRTIPWSDVELRKHPVDGLRNHFIHIVSVNKLNSNDLSTSLQGLNNEQLVQKYGNAVRGKIEKR